MTRIGDTKPSTSIQGATHQDAVCSPPAAKGELPNPLYPHGVPVDDLQMALAILQIDSRRDSRKAADVENASAAKAQDEAHARKIDKMRELADDTFSEALVDGVMKGISAAAEAGAACASFSSTRSEGSPAAATSARTSKLLEASSKASSATGTIWSGGIKSAMEHDREDMAIADRDVDRAKGRADGASAEIKRADDDIRETMNYIRQYVAAKEQLGQAAIMKA